MPNEKIGSEQKVTITIRGRKQPPKSAAARKKDIRYGPFTRIEEDEPPPEGPVLLATAPINNRLRVYSIRSKSNPVFKRDVTNINPDHPVTAHGGRAYGTQFVFPASKLLTLDIHKASAPVLLASDDMPPSLGVSFSRSEAWWPVIEGTKLCLVTITFDTTVFPNTLLWHLYVYSLADPSAPVFEERALLGSVVQDFGGATDSDFGTRVTNSGNLALLDGVVYAANQGALTVYTTGPLSQVAVVDLTGVNISDGPPSSDSLSFGGEPRLASIAIGDGFLYLGQNRDRNNDLETAGAGNLLTFSLPGLALSSSLTIGTGIALSSQDAPRVSQVLCSRNGRFLVTLMIYLPLPNTETQDWLTLYDLAAPGTPTVADTLILPRSTNGALLNSGGYITNDGFMFLPFRTGLSGPDESPGVPTHFRIYDLRSGTLNEVGRINYSLTGGTHPKTLTPVSGRGVPL